jgi:ribonuclease PH
MPMRVDGRLVDELRLVNITKDFIKYPEGSVLFEIGNTKVICNASIDDAVPPFLLNENKGWLTAEYSMLPRSTHTRSQRESIKGSLSGRTQEISRLIGRALRASLNLNKIPGKTIIVDCDVIQADGGTRVASITGGYIAVSLAIKKLLENNLIAEDPRLDYVAAISVGIIEKDVTLDLNYEEDYKANVDLNLVATGSGKIIEIQGTAEREPFDNICLQNMINFGLRGIKSLVELQKRIV